MASTTKAVKRTKGLSDKTSDVMLVVFSATKMLSRA